MLYRYEVQVQLAPGSAHLWRLAVARCHYPDLVREPARPSQHTSNAVIERRNSVAVCSGEGITGTQNIHFKSDIMYTAILPFRDLERREGVVDFYVIILIEI